MPAPVTITTFANLSAPWSLVQLDANFAAIKAGIASTNTFGNYLVDTGAANVYVVSLPVGVTAVLAAGLAIQFLAATTNTGASTLNAYGTGTVPITNFDGTAIAAGTIRAGAVVSVVYDGVQYKLVGQGASGASFVYGEVPGGVVNGVGATGNTVFTCAFTPSPAASLVVYHKNGPPFMGFGVDFTLVGQTFTFNAPSTPQVGDLLRINYQR
jgi:hypothetical protein